VQLKGAVSLAGGLIGPVTLIATLSALAVPASAKAASRQRGEGLRLRASSKYYEGRKRTHWMFRFILLYLRTIRACIDFRSAARTPGHRVQRRGQGLSARSQRERI
jgi:hypothetical protein